MLTLSTMGYKHTKGVYQLTRACNHIPVPHTTFSILEKGFWETQFRISLFYQTEGAPAAII